MAEQQQNTGATPPTGERVPPVPSLLQKHMGDTATELCQTEDARVRKVRRLFDQFPPGSKILDVGCCDGWILSTLAGKHDVHGVDIGEELVRRAKENGLKARVHDVATAPLPYKDGEFDVVFSGETIEHQVDTDWFLSELNRVLKPGGTLVLTLPNVRTLVSIGMMIFMGLPPKFSARYRASHFRDFTLKVGKIAIENHGFEILKITGSDIHLPVFGYTLSPVAALFPSWAETIIYLAVKRARSEYAMCSADESDIYGLSRKK